MRSTALLGTPLNHWQVRRFFSQTDARDARPDAMHIFFPYLYSQATTPTVPRMWAGMSSTDRIGQTPPVDPSPALDLLSILRLQMEGNPSRGFSEAFNYAEVRPEHET
jgi:hypothetical protein